MSNLKEIILEKIPIDDTRIFCLEKNLDHNEVVGILKSFEASNFVICKQFERPTFILSEEGNDAASNGSPEFRLFSALPQPPSEILKTEVERILSPAIINIGIGYCRKSKWIDMSGKGNTTTFKRLTENIPEDSVALALRKLTADPFNTSNNVDTANIKNLISRRLIKEVKQTYFSVEKGSNFGAANNPVVTVLTYEMLQENRWKNLAFKPYNLEAAGKAPTAGHLHPLLKVREEFRQILLEMGFEEMPTNNYVESSFWNFDALFQPQQHPARDMHDTFFIEDPANTIQLPSDYVERVKTMHEVGGEGSIGWRYDWKIEEASKNLLRTHTTAVSSRMLYKLAKDGFQPKKYFSIDRVFRNENLDATHLAEFHQVEGLVCDKGLTLRDLIGTIKVFFERMGISNLKFKPAYNPYTEPSMEVFGYHPMLKKWVEIGNSGIFRPEMLLPMGLPPDVRVIAWGLSLERPTMIMYSIDNIRELFGHKIDLKFVQQNPICRLDA
eukprot:TRINITY_DN8252_c0_g1_i1.p1 TRINITY_DN8252_c0_g1~~TRINITY_DN8252_c0_g1_i1.p1  ORF type:complete len:521 (-),score=253.17 TRINITY_DN8252_c0_g1_i1:88-1581(-)